MNGSSVILALVFIAGGLTGSLAFGFLFGEVSFFYVFSGLACGIVGFIGYRVAQKKDGDG